MSWIIDEFDPNRVLLSSRVCTHPDVTPEYVLNCLRCISHEFARYHLGELHLEDEAQQMVDIRQNVADEQPALVASDDLDDSEWEDASSELSESSESLDDETVEDGEQCMFVDTDSEFDIDQHASSEVDSLEYFSGEEDVCDHVLPDFEDELPEGFWLRTERLNGDALLRVSVMEKKKVVDKGYIYNAERHESNVVRTWEARPALHMELGDPSQVCESRCTEESEAADFAHQAYPRGFW